jgi:hypothetical protein
LSYYISSWALNLFHDHPESSSSMEFHFIILSSSIWPVCVHYLLFPFTVSLKG